MVQTSSDTNLSIDSPQGRKLFVFDRVFGPEVEQEGIWDYLADSVNSFAQGYNVSLLAYGQSGAGKSYTMGTSGPLDQQDTQMMGKSLAFLRAYSALPWPGCGPPQCCDWGLGGAILHDRSAPPPPPSPPLLPANTFLPSQVSFLGPQPRFSKNSRLCMAKTPASEALSATASRYPSSSPPVDMHSRTL